MTPHPPAADPDLGVDHRGRRYCRCGRPILPDDPRHTLPDQPADDVQRRAAHDTETP